MNKENADGIRELIEIARGIVEWVRQWFNRVEADENSVLDAFTRTARK